ncbi:PrgI family protein [Patescibacteria group bacterium]|nr:PrgI family protein [Patescibacteria group bacterium]
MRYQVPQFVDIEDKIIGPLTLKQFIIYVGAVGILVPLYLAFPLALFVPVAIPVLGAAVLLAHFKLNGKSLFAVIANVVSYFASGQLYIWQRQSAEDSLPVRGPEYLSFVEEEEGAATTLQIHAQAIETEGNIVDQDDLDDPMTATSNRPASS